MQDINGKEIKEGHILKHIMNVRVGTRRVKNGRSYNDYAINENREVIGVVEQGEYAVGISSKFIPCLMVNSSMSTSYDSYFMGSGKASDRPDRVEKNLSQPLFRDKKYEIIGHIEDVNVESESMGEGENSVT